MELVASELKSANDTATDASDTATDTPPSEGPEQSVKVIEKYGGDDGVRTCLAQRHLKANSGICLTLRTPDLAFRQLEATSFASMFAPCLHGATAKDPSGRPGLTN
jgi:hypothetical protein